MPKRLLEGSTVAQRAVQRQQLGTLRSLTVQPSTRNRYQKAVQAFLQFLSSESLELPRLRSQLDPLVCEFIEHLWATGQGRGLACDTLAGLQDRDAKLRGQIPAAWRLMKAWSTNEIPARAPPLPQHIVHSLAGWAFFHGHFSFGVCLILGFYGMLRTGELLGIYHHHIGVDSSTNKVLVSLGLTKGGKRTGASESVVIGFDLAVALVKRWKQVASPTTRLAPSPARFRSLFNEALTALKLQDFLFRPYSLRRGGATYWFGMHHNLDKILVQGRWQAAKTARIYINEGMSVLAEMHLPRNDTRIKPFLHVFEIQSRNPSFTALEPLLDNRRSGGLGMKKHSSKSSKQKRRGQSKKPILEVFWLVLVSGLAPLRLGEPRSFSNSPWVWPGVLDGLTGVLG